MLASRIATALVLAPLVLAGVLYLPQFWFACLFWLLAAFGCYEWAGFLRLSSVWQRLLYVGAFGVCAGMLYLNPHLYLPTLKIVSLLWGLAVLAVVMYPRGETIYRQPVTMALLGLALMVGAWVGLVVIRSQPQGAFWLIWALVLVWGADIGAYFAGRAIGGAKLAPAVSPGKTWSGAIGGFVCASMICVLGLYWLDAALLVWVPAMFGLIVLSIFGDLFESVLKRATGIKDSGTLLPGHGGVLDRIDALLAVLPVFALCLFLMQATELEPIT